MLMLQESIFPTQPNLLPPHSNPLLFLIHAPLPWSCVPVEPCTYMNIFVRVPSSGSFSSNSSHVFPHRQSIHWSCLLIQLPFRPLSILLLYFFVLFLHQVLYFTFKHFPTGIFLIFLSSYCCSFWINLFYNCLLPRFLSHTPTLGQFDKYSAESICFNSDAILFSASCAWYTARDFYRSSTFTPFPPPFTHCGFH